MEHSSNRKATVKKAVKGKVDEKKTTIKKKVTAKKVTNKKVASKPASPPGADIPSISITAEERWKMIAIAAYHKAEARGFAPGGEEQDWLGAEEEIDLLLSR